MKFSNYLILILVILFLFLFSFLLAPIVFVHPIDHCCHTPQPVDQDYHPLITNATNSDPILGHWIFPKKNRSQPFEITFMYDGYAEKTEYFNNFTFTTIRGPWTKQSENGYFVQWVVESEMSGDYHVNGSFIPINETIFYDPSTDQINVGGDFYTRKHAT